MFQTLFSCLFITIHVVAHFCQEKTTANEIFHLCCCKTLKIETCCDQQYSNIIIFCNIIITLFVFVNLTVFFSPWNLSEAQQLSLQTKLYVDIQPLKWPIVYRKEYNVHFFGFEMMHPFDAKKWGNVFQVT